LRPLSQIAVWALSSLPEVSCVLLGMRRAEYVRDALDSLKLEAPENRALWTALGVKSS
jgi:aryl-alcohol dehydrogenase-like predicted oxidoreductase